MHLKKTKKTPRMIRIIALMLSLVLAFFTMTGMAIAEEGTDVTDTAPDSTPEIVEAELELEPEPTEELPAEAPGTEKSSEPMPELEEPSIPPEPTDTPVLEPDYELDAEIPTGWHNAPVTITVRLIDKNNTGWVKIEAAFSSEDSADRFDVTEEWNEYDCHFGLWRDNRFLAAKKINLTKKMAEALLKDGKTYASGIFSEKTGKTYDAYIVLEDDGTKTAYRLEFERGKANGKQYS